MQLFFYIMWSYLFLQLKLNKNNNINKRILKKRIYIENAISIIKKNERVMTRKDHNIKSYLGFVYLTCLKHNIKILNKIL